MGRPPTPDEDLRRKLRAKVAKDDRGYDGVAAAVGIKGPSLHLFLNTPGAGSKVLPKLMKLYGFDDPSLAHLDEHQRELLRVLDLATAEGRDPAKLVQALKTISGIGEAPPRPSEHPPRPGSPKSRGTDGS